MQEDTRGIGTHLDSIRLSVFSHRFMSIAEQMGRSVRTYVYMFCIGCIL